MSHHLPHHVPHDVSVDVPQRKLQTFGVHFHAGSSGDGGGAWWHGALRQRYLLHVDGVTAGGVPLRVARVALQS